MRRYPGLRGGFAWLEMAGIRMNWRSQGAAEVATQINQMILGGWGLLSSLVIGPTQKRFGGVNPKLISVPFLEGPLS